MRPLEYVKHEKIRLKDHPQFNEAWLRDRIVEDPAILGLGEVEVRDVEHRQPGAGRLDLLLWQPESGKRYEVEIQLGATDESHIIRCLEYWDIERKRYPQYDHCAVLAAEEITSRFLNVVGLFNGFIPLVAIQLSAIRVGDNVTLHCTKVLDERVLGLEEEEVAGPPVDRAYWEDRGSKSSVALVDECLTVLRGVADSLDLKYNRYYIGLTEHGQPNNFVLFRPKKNWVGVEARLGDADPWSQRLEAAGVEVLAGGRGQGWLHFNLRREDLEQNSELLRELFAAAYGRQED